MKKELACILVLALLASTVPLAVTPAAAYEKKIFGDADGNNELTKGELVNAILPYMLDEGTFTLDDVGDAAYIYAYWDGKPMVVTDQYDRTVTLYRPVERIVPISATIARGLVELGGVDKFVGANTAHAYAEDYIYVVAYPQLLELPSVGSGQTNLESIVSLKPDVVFSGMDADLIQDKTGIPTVGLGTTYHSYKTTFDRYELASKIIGAEERCEELISFADEEIDKITEVTSEIPDSERVGVYLLFWADITKTHCTVDSPIEMAGGINVASNISAPELYSGTGIITVSKEQVIKWNPDIMLIHRYQTKEKHGSWGPGLTIEDVLSDPDLQSITAVKNGTVYYIRNGFMGCSPSTGIAESFYQAKLFYPEKFKDLDVEKEGNMILERFYGVDGLYTWMVEHCGLYNWE